jgi:hypothetical protein
MRHWKSAALGCFLWAVGVLLLGGYYREDNPLVRLLDAGEMREMAKGGTTANCTQSLFSAPCSDWVPTCVGQPQAQCIGQSCPSCSKTMAVDNSCQTSKPWTVYNCVQQKNAPGGCGVFVTGATCTWTGTQCVCQGGTQETTACDQKVATYSSPCTIVN